MKPAAQTGFTLIELLVALAVLGIALGALLAGLARYADQTGYLRQKTIAVWVAHNQLVTVELEPALPGSGTRDGSTEMGGVEWPWQQTVNTTQDPDLRRVDVRVFAPGTDNLGTETNAAPALTGLSAFMASQR